MINKVTESWDGIEEGVDQVAKDGAESRELEAILQQIVSVRGVLKKMCQVSVTRTSLKNAVREALLPVIEEHRDELFPEVVELRRRLEAAGEDPSALDVYRGGGPAVPEEFLSKLDDFEARIGKLAELESKFEADVSRLDTGVSELGERVRRDVAASDARQQERVEKVQEYLGRLEATIPETASAAAGEVESRLRKEIESMVEQLTSKLNEVQEILRRIEDFVPRREALESLDRRLAGLESAFEQVAGQVGNIDSVTPEVRGLGERFSSLRQQIADVSQTLDRATGDVRDTLAHRLDELASVLQDGISRWEADQSQVQERLSALRDSLRDQLGTLGAQVEKAEGSFWGKITGKKDAGLKLSGHEVEDLSSKLEGIIGGLEAIISKKKKQP